MIVCRRPGFVPAQRLPPLPAWTGIVSLSDANGAVNDAESAVLCRRLARNKDRLSVDSRPTDFRRFVFEHARSSGLPVLLVSHDEADAAAAGGSVIELGAGAA